MENKLRKASVQGGEEVVGYCGKQMGFKELQDLFWRRGGNKIGWGNKI